MQHARHLIIPWWSSSGEHHVSMIVACYSSHEPGGGIKCYQRRSINIEKQKYEKPTKKTKVRLVIYCVFSFMLPDLENDFRVDARNFGACVSKQEQGIMTSWNKKYVSRKQQHRHKNWFLEKVNMSCQEVNIGWVPYNITCLTCCSKYSIYNTTVSIKRYWLTYDMPIIIYSALAIVISWSD